MGFLLLEGMTQCLVIGYQLKWLCPKKVNLELFQRKNHPKSFFFAHGVSFFGFAHHPAGILDRMKHLVSSLLRRDRTYGNRRGIRFDANGDSKSGNPKADGLVKFSFKF